MLCASSPDLVRPFVQLQVIHGLLHAMANNQHFDSQVQALGTLNLIYTNSYGLADAVRISIGADVFDNIKVPLYCCAHCCNKRVRHHQGAVVLCTLL